MWFNLGIGAVLKGGLWLYVGSLLFSFLGLLYWVMASFFISPDVVGTAAAILSFEVLILTVISMGVPRGLQRFIGQSWGSADYQELSVYFFAALVFLSIVSVPVVFLLFLFPDAILGVLGFNHVEILLICVLMLLDFWPPVFYSLFKSVLRTETASLADIVLSIAKLVIGLVLLYLGFGLVGILLSFIAGSIARGILFLHTTNAFFSRHNLKRLKRPEFSAIKRLLQAGTAHWVPNTLLILSQSVGVLFLYGSVSHYQTGLYFVAFSISLVVYNLPDSILGLMFPYLSGLRDGKERATSWALRVSLAAAVAPSLALFVYPSLPFIILGGTYAGAADILRVLVLGAIVHPIVSGHISYVYAEGKYSHVAAIGLVATIGRLALCFYLGPIMGAVGVAAAYIIGTVLSLVPVYVSGRLAGFRHDWMLYTKVLLIPAVLAATLCMTSTPWLLGLPFLFCITLVLYTRLRVINKADLIEIAETFLSRESIARVAIRVRPIIKTLFEE